MPNSYRMNLILSALLLLLANTLVAAEGDVSMHSQFQVKRHLVLSAGMDQPSDLAIADDNRIYVLDGLQSRVVVFEGSGKVRTTFGNAGSGPGQLRLPMGIAIEDRQLYVADSGNNRIAIFDISGRFVRNIALKIHKGDEYLPEPVALKVVAGVITWSDRRNHRICRNDAVSGEQLNCWGK
ncbi:MAG TPA: 6-bladed beta-propeller, partial [Ectothiorhodospiraceae bacterium]|nr:6-bladed beta-propeller [Ectothiorhodospiraceae bacterium]